MRIKTIIEVVNDFKGEAIDDSINRFITYFDGYKLTEDHRVGITVCTIKKYNELLNDLASH
jgi:hypothetical protein